MRIIGLFLRVVNLKNRLLYSAEPTTGQMVVGHGSNGSTNLDGSRGSRVSTCDPLTHDPLTDGPVNQTSTKIFNNFFK